MTTTWPWQRLNDDNASAHRVLAALLEPGPGERWLDVGTGAGGLALELARAGAEVVGVDVAEDGLVHARQTASEQGLEVEFRRGDAQQLPFPDAAFDGVASAFGVMFAEDARRAAAELARVCRTGGKLGLTLMPQDSRAAMIFAVLARFGREGPNPAKWEESVEQLLGDDFELEVERRQSPPAAPAPEQSWEERVQSWAPLRLVVERLDDTAVAALRAELEAVEHRFRDRRRSYLIVAGRRR